MNIVLALITTVTFIFVQKMLMIRPANEEQALQQKMLSYMILLMGLLFYKVPSEICIYLIAANLTVMATLKFIRSRRDIRQNMSCDSTPTSKC